MTYLHVSINDIINFVLKQITFSSPITLQCLDVCQMVYWSDVKDKAIYRSSLAGAGEREVFLNTSHGIGIVEGQSSYYTSVKDYT